MKRAFAKDEKGIPINFERFEKEKQIEVPNLYTIFHLVRETDYYFPGELHEPWEMLYVIDGTVRETAEERTYILHTGDILFHKPMEFHRLWAENHEPAEIFVITFDIEGEYACRFGGPPFKLSDNHRRFMQRIIECYDAIGVQIPPDTPEQTERLNDPTRKKNHQITMRLFEAFLYTLALSEHTVLEHEESESVYLYTRIMRLLEDHVEDSITIEELAGICKASAAAMQKCFRYYTGYSIHNFFIKLKVRRSVELIRQSMKNYEISEKLGFGSPNYFCRVFMRETGKHPGEYR